MAKENEGFFTKLLKKELVPMVTKYLKSLFDAEVKSIEKAIDKRINKKIRHFYLSLTIFSGILFLMLGFALLIEEMISFPRGSGFIFIGIIIAICAFIIKASSRD